MPGKAGRKELFDFLKEVAEHKFGTIFLPEDPDTFYEDTRASIIQLGFPTILSAGMLKEQKGGQISLSLLRRLIMNRKMKPKKAIIIGTSEEDFKLFKGKNFEFILVSKEADSGYNGQYQVVNSLADIMPVLRPK